MAVDVEVIYCGTWAVCVWQILLSTDTVAWAKNYFTDKSNLKWSVLKEFFQQQKIIFFLLLSTSE